MIVAAGLGTGTSVTTVAKPEMLALLMTTLREVLSAKSRTVTQTVTASRSLSVNVKKRSLTTSNRAEWTG